ncbi:PilT protein domain protein [Methylacidimicrobium sp. AP8]|uniref:PIN domain-containing protein n=1 Tax=Methylacidimicrobium sp. AP8 TaxID=2730359 RepID=UPI0018C1A32A|nr:PIN domain-containing protein [Methylacidimicrobium sp. AP8]CAB4243939.1 PilT protein domain protein [Methylacidimicrobium sp. AP8]
MRALFDTSVLIPVFLEDHEHHEPSLQAFLDAEKSLDCCAAHSLAEVYSVMTRFPGRHRLSGEQVLLFLAQIRERLTLVALSPEEYYTAVERAADAGIVGGTVYDGLIVHCARKAKAEAIYTWNKRNFARFGPEIEARLRIP